MAPNHEQDGSMIPNLLFSKSGSDKSSFACDQCKKKKIKCDKTAPQCGHCRRLGRGCEYPISVPKPGPKAGSLRRHRSSSGDGEDRQVKTRHQHGGEEPARSQVDLEYTRTMAFTHPDHHLPPKTSPAGHKSSISPTQNHPGHSDAFNEALALLEISEAQCNDITSLFFANNTSYSLFHQPSFDKKLRSIDSEKEIRALISAFGSFTYHFKFSGLRHPLGDNSLWDMSRRLVRECLDECEDETPPLHLLQALILVAWQKVYQGVRGTAWRVVGECIRVAYELRLNKELEENDQPTDWIVREERRRCWWSCWELDTFTSTIKQVPKMMDWASNDVLLPMSDDQWNEGIEGPSCPLNRDPNARWRDLQKTGNDNWISWFILFNSYKYDAFLLSKTPILWSKRKPVNKNSVSTESLVDLAKKRETLVNCLQCAQMALPDHLSVGKSFLSFQPPERVRDAGRFSIHLMNQVTRFMLYRLVIFRVLPSRSQGNNSVRVSAPATTSVDFREDPPPPPLPPSQQQQQQQQRRNSDGLAWEHFLASAEEASTLIRNSSQDHIHYVNPCLSNAIWFAASALVVGRMLAPKPADRQWMTSNFDLLWATLRQYIRVWNVPSTLVDRFDALEEHLKRLGINDNEDGDDDGEGEDEDDENATTTAVATSTANGARVRSRKRKSTLENGNDGDDAMPCVGDILIAPPHEVKKRHKGKYSVEDQSGAATHPTPTASQPDIGHNDGMPTPAASDPGPPPLGDEIMTSGLSFDSESPNFDVTSSLFNSLSDVDLSGYLDMSCDFGLDFDFFRCPFE